MNTSKAGFTSTTSRLNPITFLREVREELGKVIWPTREETIRLTILVIIVTVGVALFVGALDFGLTKLMEIVILNR